MDRFAPFELPGMVQNPADEEKDFGAKPAAAAGKTNG
jgi:hypothetical protein